MSARYQIEPKIMWTAICNACGKDILDNRYADHVAYTDRNSVSEVVGDWEGGYVGCPHCNAPLTDREAEFRAEMKLEEQ